MGINFGVGPLEVDIGQDRGPTMPGAGQIDDVRIGLANQVVQMRVDEAQAGGCSPVTQKARLDVLGPQRFAQEWIVLKVDLTDRQVVRCPPVRIQLGDLFLRDRARHDLPLVTSVFASCHLAERTTAISSSVRSNSAQRYLRDEVVHFDSFRGATPTPFRRRLKWKAPSAVVVKGLLAPAFGEYEEGPFQENFVEDKFRRTPGGKNRGCSRPAPLNHECERHIGASAQPSNRRGSSQRRLISVQTRTMNPSGDVHRINGKLSATRSRCALRCARQALEASGDDNPSSFCMEGQRGENWNESSRLPGSSLYHGRPAAAGEWPAIRDARKENGQKQGSNSQKPSIDFHGPLLDCSFSFAHPAGILSWHSSAGVPD